MENQQAKMNRLCETAALEKMQRLVSRRDYSNKSIYCESRNLPLQWKIAQTPQYYSITGKPRNPTTTQNATNQRLAMIMSALRTWSIPEPQSSLALRVSLI